MIRGSIESALVTAYHTRLREPYRPPSRGGNVRALHAHYLTIDGELYSFLALGTRRWVFKGDKISFEYEAKGPYRDIDRATIQTVNAKGRLVVRGDRGFKSQLRTAETRLPSSRREAND